MDIYGQFRNVFILRPQAKFNQQGKSNTYQCSAAFQPFSLNL